MRQRPGAKGAIGLCLGLAGVVWLVTSLIGSGLWARADADGVSVIYARGGMMGGMGCGGMMGGGSGSQQFTSNGERIYMTGVSERTGPIPRAGGRCGFA